MSNQPPFGGQPLPGWGPQGNPPQGNPPQGNPPQGNPPQGFPPQGQQPPPGGYGGPPGGYGGQPPGGQPPGGYGGQPPGGQPPGGYGGAPPGFGGPGGFQGPGGPGGPGGSSSKAPLIIGIIAAVLVIGGIVGTIFVLNSGDDDVAVGPVGTEPEASQSATSTPTATPVPTATPTPAPVPPPPSATPTTPGAPTPPPTPPPAPPAPPGGAMTMGESVSGEITTTDGTQDFFFDGVTGEEIVLTAISTSELDPRLTLYAPDGSVVAENDDATGLPSAFDSRISTSLPADGEYRIEVSAFSGSGSFELTLDFPAVLSATDTLSASIPEIVYDYPGVAGQVIVINMRALDDAIDPLVYLLDPDGNEIGRDDDGGDVGFDSRLEITLPVDGTYTIVASTFSDRYGMYEIAVTEL